MNDHIVLASRWKPQTAPPQFRFYQIEFENLNQDPKSGYSKRWGANHRHFRTPEFKDGAVNVRKWLTAEEYDQLLSEIPEDAAP